MPIQPVGRSVITLGPSGTGKSTLCRQAAESLGSGVIMTIPGTDEMESYAKLYSNATSPIWNEDGTVTWDIDAPYLIAPFDDADFAPSLGREGLQADGQKRMIGFLRAVRQLAQQDRAEGKPLRYACVIQDTWSGIGDLSVNAMLSKMKLIDPPPAMSPEGSTYFGGLQTRMNDVARNTRVLKGLGMHWIATSHVRKIEASDAARGAAPTSTREQLMPLIVGGFRERLTPMFDLVLHSEVQKDGSYKLLWKADMSRGAKSRYGQLAEENVLPNDWDEVWASIDRAVAS